MGNNDWNVYCLADYAVLSSSVTVELARSRVVLGESVAGSGRLVPGMADALVVVSFVRPDGVVDDVQVATVEGGVFNFSYRPDVAGNWTVAARWLSTRGYYGSAYSEHVPLEVAAAPTSTGIPIEYFYAIVGAIAVLAIVIAVVVHRRKPK